MMMAMEVMLVMSAMKVAINYLLITLIVCLIFYLMFIAHKYIDEYL